jgi:hypothetical protein
VRLCLLPILCLMRSYVWKCVLTCQIIIKSLLTCLFYANLGSYTVYDFATSDVTYSELVPMGIEAYKNGKYICAKFSVISSSQSYFPIIRIEKWETAPYLLFDSESLGIFSSKKGLKCEKDSFIHLRYCSC